jgi:hypothetical protein
MDAVSDRPYRVVGNANLGYWHPSAMDGKIFGLIHSHSLSVTPAQRRPMKSNLPTVGGINLQSLKLNTAPFAVFFERFGSLDGLVAGFLATKGSTRRIAHDDRLPCPAHPAEQGSRTCSA